MNLAFAREVGLLRYVWRRISWRVLPPSSLRLHTGVNFPLPRSKAFAADAYVTQGNVDWNAEYILAAFLMQRSTRGDFLDVGAHIGYYSALLSPLVARVYAFEPDARNHPFLQQNLSALPNAEIIRTAVCDREGRMNFCDDGESSLSRLDPSGNSPGGTVVETTTVDAFVASRDARPAAIKVDIEGFDILALQGALHTAQRLHPVFLVEFNQESGKPNTWAALADFLRDADYSLYVISSEPLNRLSGYHYTFRRRTAEETQKLSTKMLFLVPATEQAWFDSFIEKNGQWTSQAHRPGAVRALLTDYGLRQ
jgi:FkbM family methyltransferase